MLSEDAERAAASGARLEALGYSLDVAGFADALQAGEVAVRAEAAFLLGHTGDTSALAAVRRSLEDAEARVRAEAGLALARLGAEDEAIPALQAELGGAFFQDAPLRAARALALLGDPSGYARVLEALASPLPSNRMEAIAVLPTFLPHRGQVVAGQTVDPVGTLARAAGDAESLLRRDALSALAETDDPRVERALQVAATDSDATVRELARALLGSSRSK